MFHRIQVIVLILLIPIGGLYLYSEREGMAFRDIFTFGDSTIVHVGEIPIKVEIVQTPEERIQGLSGREALTGVDGMLFVFDTAERQSMWMKDMSFPIDIIWIDENLTVVGVERSVSPDSYPKKFFSPGPVRYAIETTDRYTETFGIYPGDSVRLPIQLEREAK